MNLTDRIIVPLDVPNLEQAIALLVTLPEVNFWKVGLELFVSAGPKILTVLKERDKKIFLDLKFHDIPNTVAGACRSACDYGVDLLTLHTAAGRKALEAASKVIKEHDSPPQLLGITLLTSLNSRELAFDLHVSIELPEYTLQMALLAQESGINGAVCSPQEVSQLRQVCDPAFLLVCPGIRPSWSQSNDQRRTMTPAQAFKAGADYLVIGRPITQTPNPQEAWSKICSELD